LREKILLVVFSLACSADASSATIDGVPTSTAAFIGTARSGDLDTPTLVTSYSEFLRTFGEFDAGRAIPYLAPSLAAFFQNGGGRAYIVRVADSSDESYVGDAATPGGPTGLQSLRAIDDVGVISIPGVSSTAVQAAMIAQCEEFGDRFAILDSELGVDIDSVLHHRERLESARGYAALYYPWVRVLAEDIPGAMLPPSGFVAGIYARTDRERGVWKAPTGAVLGALGLAFTVGVLDSDVLNTAGVDVLRSFPGEGILVWGVRTIATDPDFRYVNVRRFLIYLEESIDKGIQWAVFEPNDESLWTLLRSEVEDFLLAAWRDGALLGTTPAQAFFVRCDRTTMTQEDIDQGRTVIEVGVATLRPAEFVILRFGIERQPAGPVFRRGDSNGDAVFDISDPVAVLGFLFQGGKAPACAGAADLDGNGGLDINDPVFGLNFLFLGGPAPAEPFQACGIDPRPGALDCQAPAACP
jgi:Bacteriophage tail sheath protein